MEIHVFFANLSWFLLIGILLLRPLAEITRWKILIKAMKYRRWAGISCAVAALLHVVIFLFSKGLLTEYFFNSRYWRFDRFWGWGNLALIFMLFPLATSNRRSQLFLRKNWKRIQRFTYPAFITTAIHVALAEKQYLAGLLPLAIWAAAWSTAKILRRKRQRAVA